MSAAGAQGAAAADDDDDDDDNDDENYDPYLTIRRNMRHADDDFTSVLWLRKVSTVSCLRQYV